MGAEVEQLLYREAYLLDSGLYQEWLDLLAPDLRYWAPARAELGREREQADETQRLALFNETKPSLALRISRLGTGLAWVENPATRTRRFIANVMASGADANGVIPIRSNFMVFKSRGNSDETILVGCREDKWSNGGKWLLKERKILIDHWALENLSVLL